MTTFSGVVYLVPFFTVRTDRLKLYHFTNFWSLKNAGPDAILEAGLKAHDPNEDYPMFGGKLRPCVWLTSQTELPVKMQKAAAQEVRITVELSSASKRLISWPRLLRRLRIFNEAGGAASERLPLTSSGFRPNGLFHRALQEWRAGCCEERARIRNPWQAQIRGDSHPVLSGAQSLDSAYEVAAARKVAGHWAYPALGATSSDGSSRGRRGQG